MKGSHLILITVIFTESYQQVEGRLSSVVHHSSPVPEGEIYKITLRLSTYNPVNTEGTVTVLDRLTDKQYDIHVHIAAGNFTTGS